MAQLKDDACRRVRFDSAIATTEGTVRISLILLRDLSDRCEQFQVTIRSGEDALIKLRSESNQSTAENGELSRRLREQMDRIQQQQDLIRLENLHLLRSESSARVAAVFYRGTRSLTNCTSC